MNLEALIQEKLRAVFQDERIRFDKSRFAGGLTNYNYIQEIHGTEYVIRQPGGMTDQIIDRKQEKVNNTITSAYGVNSHCIYFDEDSGIKVSTYITDSKNMACANPSSPQNLAAVSRLMKQIHSIPQHFANCFDWQVELAKYEKLIRQLGGELFFDYPDLKNQLVSFVQDNVKIASLVPCHNDTVPENFIVDSAGRTYLIDWEYAGMNDPCWDVAAYILESKLSEDAIHDLVHYYFGRPLQPAEEIKLKSFMMVQDLLWTAWALIRHYNGDDFLEYCCLRYERFRKNSKLITQSLHCSLADMVASG